MQESTHSFLENIDNSIEKGIDYLHEHQYPNGEFCCYYAPDDKMQEWCVPDSTVFPASIIASCLLKLKHHPKVNEILKLTANFLRYQMMTGGVWNFFTKWNPLFKYSPADSDDTAISSIVLNSLGIEFPDNKTILTHSRNSKGLFYTWLVVRPSTNLRFLKIMARELKRPWKTILFWLKHEVNRGDVDAVVNSNVLYYLGLNDSTKPIINYLLDVIKNNEEELSDNWYKNSILFYYFLSRNYVTIKDLEPAKETILRRLTKLKNLDGSFGKSVFDNALAISTFINFNIKNMEVEQAVHALIKSQSASGNWKRHIFFYAGPSKEVGWGSEEVITAHCIEALHYYRSSI